MNSIKKAWLNLVFLIITLVVNTLGAIGLINGLTQKEISDLYVTLITPSPSTFSIWSVIYSLLIISVIVMIVKKNDPYYQKAIDQISPLYLLSCIMNILWIVLFSFVLVELSFIFYSRLFDHPDLDRQKAAGHPARPSLAFTPEFWPLCRLAVRCHGRQRRRCTRQTELEWFRPV